MAELSQLRDALQRLAEGEELAARAATIRAAALSDLIRAAVEPAPAPIKGAPDLLTMAEACRIARLSRWTINEKTRGMSWRFEHPNRTMLERAPFLRWLDQHRAGAAK